MFQKGCIKTFTRITRVSVKDCIAFGDGMNDVEMLSWAGKGCIMKDADIRLKWLVQS